MIMKITSQFICIANGAAGTCCGFPSLHWLYACCRNLLEERRAFIGLGLGAVFSSSSTNSKWKKKTKQNKMMITWNSVDLHLRSRCLVVCLATSVSLILSLLLSSLQFHRVTVYPLLSKMSTAPRMAAKVRVETWKWTKLVTMLTFCKRDIGHSYGYNRKTNIDRRPKNLACETC